MSSSTFSGPVISQAGFQTTSTVTAGGSTQSIVGGVTSAGAATPGIYIGSGAPTITAPQGSLYLNATGSTTATRLYVNTTGSTTWTNFTSVA